MGVQLEAVHFNHDPGSASNDALSIRGNAARPVVTPEWRRGACAAPEDSPAAYALDATRGNAITIRARFRRVDPTLPGVEVRAIDPAARAQGCLYALYRRLGIIPFVPPQPGNVLGEVAPRFVSFGGDLSAFETFTLAGARLDSAGVGAWTVAWQWQYRARPTDPWVNFDRTEHRIYTLVEVPKDPWTQSSDPADPFLPWTEVLEYACRWARGASTPDAAASAVTRAVYDLGPSVVTYDCPGGGGTHYMGPGGFAATAFLDRLRGGIGQGIYVNCTDCASIVMTFSNVLGCDLWRSDMGYGFDLNPLLAIGSSAWQTACGWPAFFYHAVAWKGECTSEDAIFDACLQVDGDADPTAADPAHTPLLPTNMKFGTPGSGDYRDRLATPAGRPNCEPQPDWRFRPRPL